MVDVTIFGITPDGLYAVIAGKEDGYYLDFLPLEKISTVGISNIMTNNMTASFKKKNPKDMYWNIVPEIALPHLKDDLPLVLKVPMSSRVWNEEDGELEVEVAYTCLPVSYGMYKKLPIEELMDKYNPEIEESTFIVHTEFFDDDIPDKFYQSILKTGR